MAEDLRVEKENADPEGIRKYQTWKANTTNLLIETMRLDKETADMDRQEFIEQKVKRISKILRPLRSSSRQDYPVNSSAPPLPEPAPAQPCLAVPRRRNIVV